MLAITAAGYDPNSRCWRDTVLPSAAGQPFVGADAALESLAHPDGSISGPNVFSAAYATGQAVQGIERSWLPVARGGRRGVRRRVGRTAGDTDAAGRDPGSRGARGAALHRMNARRLVARVGVALAAGLVACTAGVAEAAVTAQATSTAVVIVDTGGGARRSVVHFDGAVSGLEALQLAGANPVTITFGALGQAVCQLYGVGDAPVPSRCPGGWTYFRAVGGAGGWTQSGAGASNTLVHDGDVEGWKYGGGQPPFASYCSVVGCAPPPTAAPPATAPPATAPPATDAPSGPAAGGGAPTGSAARRAPFDDRRRCALGDDHAGCPGDDDPPRGPVDHGAPGGCERGPWRR